MFRKKPVVVKAVRWTRNNFDDIVDLKGGTGMGLCVDENGHLLINTLEGMMAANPGDWVIRGVKGEIYPCKPDIFAETYEEVAGAQA